MLAAFSSPEPAVRRAGPAARRPALPHAPERSASSPMSRVTFTHSLRFDARSKRPRQPQQVPFKRFGYHLIRQDFRTEMSSAESCENMLADAS
jgi:hypothetical protein